MTEIKNSDFTLKINKTWNKKFYLYLSFRNLLTFYIKGKGFSLSLGSGPFYRVTNFAPNIKAERFYA